MAYPLPSRHGNRPAYLDRLFEEAPQPTTTIQPFIRSPNSSISSIDSQLQPADRRTRQLATVSSFDEDHSDKISVRSLRLQLSPRSKIRRIFSRRAVPEVLETTEMNDSTSTIGWEGAAIPRTRSFPMLQLSSPPRRLRKNGSPSTTAATTEAEDLHSIPCYYFAARNCNGHVFAREYGGACEDCAVSITFP